MLPSRPAQYVKYDCGRCGFTKGPIVINKSGKTSVGSCPQCQATGPWTVNSQQTVYRNYQKITLQETPGTVPAGRLPRYKEIILLNDVRFLFFFFWCLPYIPPPPSSLLLF